MSLEALTYQQFERAGFGLRHMRAGSKDTTLLCFPHAGGQSLAFRAFALHVDADCQVLAVDPPGHGWSTAPAIDEIDVLADMYLGHLPSAMWPNSILLGHSMGGYVVTAIAHRLQAQGMAPRAVIVSGTRPPHRRAAFSSHATSSDDVLVDSLRDIADTPQTLLSHFLPTIRADFRAFERWSPPAVPLALRALILGGMRDRACLSHHVIEWDRYYVNCEFGWVDGPHLFLQSEPEVSAGIVSSFVRTLPAPPNAPPARCRPACTT